MTNKDEIQFFGRSCPGRLLPPRAVGAPRARCRGGKARPRWSGRRV